mgnify:CR=1 FL=1
MSSFRVEALTVNADGFDDLIITSDMVYDAKGSQGIQFLRFFENFQLKNIKRNKIPFLRRKIGIVFQDFQLLTDRNVFDNLKFVLEATGWGAKDAISVWL